MLHPTKPNPWSGLALAPKLTGIAEATSGGQKDTGEPTPVRRLSLLHSGLTADPMPIQTVSLSHRHYFPATSAITSGLGRRSSNRM